MKPTSQVILHSNLVLNTFEMVSSPPHIPNRQLDLDISKQKKVNICAWYKQVIEFETIFFMRASSVRQLISYRVKTGKIIDKNRVPLDHHIKQHM